MSEEVIKEIENYLDYEGSVSIQAIAILYSVYNKEKEENKELKEKVNRQQEQLNIANKKILAQKGQLKVVNNSYIPKSKVKELYEHYKNTGYDELEEVLQELLEEGE